MAALSEGAGKGIGIASTVLSGIGAIATGRSVKKASESEADQLVARAKARRAEGGAAAREEIRQKRLIKSRAQAVMAAQGANLSDPTLVNLMGDLEAEGQYRALSRLFEGDDEARGLEEAARIRRKEGKAAQKAGLFRGVTNVLSGVSSLRSRYV